MFRPFATFRLFDIFHAPNGAATPVDPGGTDNLLLESGDALLLESGDLILLEQQAETYYVLVGGMRILAGADLITVGVQ